ncbi:glyoxalase/bleomycin resistance protein/dioxygenase superfamily protein [Actinomadura pelletieri DSM 43383]|uniref:Glyoxalase/bleomycin resistance protein/dioxygenase superfamily protein n=1 Tax=Actinomadura pelletieri DSM 43383 TaxID=1120940 RepID=A0A495QMZ5_9ACTN|nr:VOC family protein [Actinomadura pelletieri]RKS74289.1 glyoxalase/bleomycin resistance protein/dioxygenase superfamily protein [Actinomadura pelletieri DSM 43383]
MTITLNHTVVTAADNAEAARFFATVMDLPYTGPHPHAPHFVPIRVNASLTLDFLTVPHPQGHHLAFDVDTETFNTTIDRLNAHRIPYGSDPAHPDNGRVDHTPPTGGRSLYFSDPSGNLYELISP